MLPRTVSDFASPRNSSMSVAYTRRKSVVCCRFSPSTSSVRLGGRPYWPPVTPPQRNATLSQNSNTAMQERDRHIRAIERHGRREWYKLSGCAKRSMVENAVYRYKTLIGPEMRTRTLARQRVEHRIGCEILNKMTALGMPDTYCAG